jgi:hypothetical protein
VQCVVVALVFQIRDDQRVGIGHGGIAGQAELPRSPVAQQLVASRIALPDLLVVNALVLKSLLTFVEGRHGGGSIFDLHQCGIEE